MRLYTCVCEFESGMDGLANVTAASLEDIWGDVACLNSNHKLQKKELVRVEGVGGGKGKWIAGSSE